MTTEISDKIYGELKETEEVLNEENLSRFIVDFSLSLPTRIKALSMYYKKEGGNNTVELVNKLSIMYEMSGTKLIRQFLFTICENDLLEPFLQSLAARSLVSYDEKDDLGYRAIDIVYPRFGPEIGTPYKIEFVKMLMNNDNYRDKARDHFIDIINDQSIDCDYRYKVILSLENKQESNSDVEEVKSKRMLYFIKQALLQFLSQGKNRTLYRILAGQYLLQKCEITEERGMIEDFLLSFSRDTELDYNLRADSTDVLLQLGSDVSKSIAKDIILHLGIGNKNVLTVYDNSQNVHTKEIEDSVKDALEFLQTFELMKYQGKSITVEFVEKKIGDILKEEKKALGVSKYEKEEKINVAFNRIVMDRALYSKYNCTLSHILLQIWTYLWGHENEKEITGRLMEELYEMAGTCSSGFASRLINTISGFGDFSMKISWRDQIIANLSGRLNARIRDMDNLTLQEKVLEEMTIPSANYDLRKNFLKFLRKNMLSIREEMYEEFKKHISDTDFDLYFRGAVSVYENGE